MTVAEHRRYVVATTQQAREIARRHLEALGYGTLRLGLPEIDDRYHIWRVAASSGQQNLALPAAEIVLDAYTAEVLAGKSSSHALLASHAAAAGSIVPRKKSAKPQVSPLSSAIHLGDSQKVLAELPPESVNLVFTSPPYFNAKREYSEYDSYKAYLELLREVFAACHRVLAEGRFLVVNISPVLVRRVSRSEASRRLPLPFHLNHILEDLDFEFIDDIHWVKPSGAGWALGRGRRFAADRQPLQYKPVVVTEYVLVYRKRTERLIDWNIREHPDRAAVLDSRIADGYEATNLWRVSPSTDRRHAAPFPLGLAERVVAYYSFKGDVVLDPFAGSGTTGRAASKAGRRYVLIDNDPSAVQVMLDDHAAGSLVGPLEVHAADVGAAPESSILLESSDAVLP